MRIPVSYDVRRFEQRPKYCTRAPCPNVVRGASRNRRFINTATLEWIRSICVDVVLKRKDQGRNRNVDKYPDFRRVTFGKVEETLEKTRDPVLV